MIKTLKNLTIKPKNDIIEYIKLTCQHCKKTFTQSSRDFIFVDKNEADIVHICPRCKKVSFIKLIEY